jgi:outer membrane protein
MVTKIISCSLFCLAIFSQTPCRAQDSTSHPPTAKWDLQSCLDYAKKNNIQINGLRLSEKTSEQEYLLSRAAREPNLTGAVGTTYTHSKNANPVVGGFQTQSSFAATYSLNSSVTLYNGGYLRNDIKEKNLQIQSANLNIVQSENDITLQITQAYLNILLAKENIIYIKDLLSSTDSQVVQSKKQYDAGSIARNALITIQAQLANDKYTLVTAQSTERQNKLTLKQLLQLPFRDSFDIVSPDTIISTEAIPALEQVENSALQNRPEIKNGQTGVNIAQYELAKARAGLLPSLVASGTIASGYSNNQTIDYFQQADNNFFQRVGLTLSIPIFTNRVARTNIENAKIQIDQAKLNLKNTQTILAEAIEQAYINVQNAQGQYDAAVEELKASAESFRIAGEELKVGASNQAAYLLQKTLYTQAFQQYIQAKYNAALNVKIYDFYMGIAIKI